MQYVNLLYDCNSALTDHFVPWCFLIHWNLATEFGHWFLNKVDSLYRINNWEMVVINLILYLFVSIGIQEICCKSNIKKRKMKWNIGLLVKYGSTGEHLLTFFCTWHRNSVSELAYFLILSHRFHLKNQGGDFKKLKIKYLYTRVCIYKMKYKTAILINQLLYKCLTWRFWVWTPQLACPQPHLSRRSTESTKCVAK